MRGVDGSTAARAHARPCVCMGLACSGALRTIAPTRAARARPPQALHRAHHEAQHSPRRARHPLPVWRHVRGGEHAEPAGGRAWWTHGHASAAAARSSCTQQLMTRAAHTAGQRLHTACSGSADSGQPGSVPSSQLDHHCPAHPSPARAGPAGGDAQLALGPDLQLRPGPAGVGRWGGCGEGACRGVCGRGGEAGSCGTVPRPLASQRACPY